MASQMARLSQSTACLRFFGDSLNPEEVTSLLGRPPSRSRLMGEELIGKVTGRRSISKTGAWLLSTKDRSPGDLDAQIAELLDGLTNDLEVWRDLSSRYRADVFCGLFMHKGNEEISVSPRTMLALGERCLGLDLDLYRGDDDVTGEPT